MANTMVSGYETGGSQFTRMGVPQSTQSFGKREIGRADGIGSDALLVSQSDRSYELNSGSRNQTGYRVVKRTKAAKIFWALVSVLSCLIGGNWLILFGCTVTVCMGYLAFRWGPLIYTVGTQVVVDTTLAWLENPPVMVILVGTICLLYTLIVLMMWLTREETEILGKEGGSSIRCGQSQIHELPTPEVSFTPIHDSRLNPHSTPFIPSSESGNKYPDTPMPPKRRLVVESPKKVEIKKEEPENSKYVEKAELNNLVQSLKQTLLEETQSIKTELSKKWQEDDDIEIVSEAPEPEDKTISVRVDSDYLSYLKMMAKGAQSDQMKSIKEEETMVKTPVEVKTGSVNSTPIRVSNTPPMTCDISSIGSKDSGVESVNDDSDEAPSPKQDKVKFTRIFNGEGRNCDSWMDFIKYFEKIAKQNGWNSQDKLARLELSLRGSAESFVNNMQTDNSLTYYELCDKLTERFGPRCQKATYLAEVRGRMKKSDEDFRTFGQAIELMCNKAFPDSYSSSEMMSMEIFMENCGNADLTLHLKSKDCKTMDGLIREAAFFDNVVAKHLKDRKSRVHEVCEVQTVPVCQLVQPMQSTVPVNQMVMQPQYQSPPMVQNQGQYMGQNQYQGSPANQGQYQGPPRGGNGQGQGPKNNKSGEQFCYN